jgi:carboxyl-terminal processing protease
MKSKWLLGFIGTVGILISMTAGAWFGYHQVRSTSILEEKKIVNTKEMDKIAQVFEIVSDRYVEKINKTKLAEGAIKGILGQLDDPYSVYMNAKLAAQFEESLDSSFQGIGAEISEADGKIIIMSPFKDSPAEKAGLLSNDRIVSIDGKDTTGWTVSDVVDKIRGPKGSSLKLGILRAGTDHSIEISVKRDEIPINTILSKMKKIDDKNIGSILITQFSEKTAPDFEKALNKLEKQKLNGLIIDVRDNPGGLLSSVGDILGDFIPKSSPYIQIQDRNNKKEKFYTKLKSKKPYPIVILQNGGSASAAEILSAAMSEAGGYKIIGENSFGKGTVQQAISLGDGSEVKMTFFKWLTPNGTWIHKKGVVPDLVVHQPDYFSIHSIKIENNLLKNQNSDSIKVMQQMLVANGFAPGRVDGYFDDQTELSVKAFQRSEDLKVSGIVNQDLINLMQKNISAMVDDERNDLQMKAAMEWITAH